ncbi:TPA: hypothetical protein N0F65_001653, partial [Lagenidium giganteum]
VITMQLSLFAALAFFSAVVAGDAVGASGDKQWGYRASDDKSFGPPQWGEKFPNCNGKRQSPIDINLRDACGVADSTPAPLQFAGECSKFNMKQTSDSYKGEVQNGTCTVSVNKKDYSMLQFHIHSPSEHTINGKAFDAEAHFVHKNADGSGLLVVGLFLEKQANVKTDPWLSSVWQTLGNVNSNKTVPMELGSYSALLTAHVAKCHAFNYPGSLTTPTCDEIVDWWVIEKPLPVSPEDFDQFQKHLERLPATDKGHGARPVQPLNGRTVVVY